MQCRPMARASAAGWSASSTTSRILPEKRRLTMDLSVDQEALLRRTRNAVVSTVDSKGSPHISPVWFLWDGELIRISTPAWTRKVLDLRDNPRIAVCVDDQAAGDYLALYG